MRIKTKWIFQIRNAGFSFYMIAYIMYFISLFMEDLAIQFVPATKLIRFTSYFLFFILALSRCQNTRPLVIAAFIISMIFAAFTKDIYFCVFIMIMLASNKQNPKTVFEVSFYLLSALTIIIVLLSAINVFPNLNTANQNYELRMSFGFYHSNVLPMVVCYLLGYRFMIKGNSINNNELLFWLVLSSGVFSVCKGRNGFIGIICLIVGYLFYRNKNVFKGLYYVSMFSTLGASVLLLVLALMQGRQNRVLYDINRMFTGRLALAYHQIHSTGLHIINLMDKNNFSLVDSFVLDSGYLYVAIHYGLLFTFVYSAFQIVLAKKYKYNAIALLALLVNTITNSIDNDLFSYNMLPFFVILAANIDSNTMIKTLLNKLHLLKKKGFPVKDR